MFLTLPYFAKTLGMEAYGLVGLYSALQVWLGIFDFGMPAAVAREVARFQAGATNSRHLSDLFASVEGLLALVGLGVLLMIAALSGWAANHWLKLETLNKDTVSTVFYVLAIIISTRFVENLYKAVLQGFQKQIQLNLLNAVIATIRWGGNAVWFMVTSPTLYRFFFWQAGVSLLSFILYFLAARAALPKDRPRGTFQLAVIKSVGSFAGEFVVTSVLAMFLTNLDKIILSRSVSLAEFGSYSLAWSVASLLYMAGLPTGQYFYPKVVAAVARESEAGIGFVYRNFSTAMAIAVVPITVYVALYAEPLLLIWTRKAEMAAAARNLVILLLVGNMFNLLMSCPFYLQLAYGWVRFSVVLNVSLLCASAPALLFLTGRYGPAGAAAVWAGLNFLCITVPVVIMHRRLLRHELWAWYWNIVALPIGVSVAWGGVSRLCTGSLLPESLAGIGNCAVGFVLTVGGVLLTFRHRLTAALGHRLPAPPILTGQSEPI